LKKEQQNKVCIISLGCPKNLVDSEVMGGLLRKAGYQLVQDHDHADIAIVNTCAFINPAKEESIEEILRLAEAKKKIIHKCALWLQGVLPSATDKNFFTTSGGRFVYGHRRNWPYCPSYQKTSSENISETIRYLPGFLFNERSIPAHACTPSSQCLP